MDADTFLWLVLPLLVALAGAYYSARRDHSAVTDHEDRLRKLEAVTAYREGAESVGLPEQPTVDISDFKIWRQQTKSNTAAIENHRRRLDALEGETE